jgi:hypothetical protein
MSSVFFVSYKVLDKMKRKGQYLDIFRIVRSTSNYDLLNTYTHVCDTTRQIKQ